MLQPGSLVLDGRYRVVRHLSQGGMGEVYLGEQVALGRKVALKVLRQDLAMQPGMSERFAREARMLSSVEHPAVVRVVEFGQSDAATCLVMELVEGETLQTALAQGPLSPTKALPLFLQLCEGLAAIHEKGIIHRDLKPENVVLSPVEGGIQAKLLDFGIARLAEPDRASNVSQVGTVVGTPEYVSPEQAIGSKLDARSDLYAFGVLMYRTLSGKLPFPGPTPQKFLSQHVTATPKPLDDAAPQLRTERTLCEVVMRCLEKDPENRFDSARVLAGELRAVVPGSAFVPAGAELPSSSGTAVFPGRGVMGGPPAQGAMGGIAGSSGTSVFGPGAIADAPSARPSTGVSGLRPSLTNITLPAPRPQTLTVMLTDIVGFTKRTSEQTLEENARMLAEHDRLLLPLVRQFEGKLVQKRGDALLVTFRSPTGALACGMALQDRLWRSNRKLPESQQIHIRVALHLGELVVSKDSLIGEPMQVVELVEKVAERGEVTFTEAVNLARNRSDAEVEECGQVELPMRRETLRLYRCRRSTIGFPFGGRDAGSGVARLKKVSKWAAVGVGVAAIGAVAIPFALRHLGPLSRARTLVQNGDAEGALQLLEKTERESGATPDLRELRAAALHQTGAHDDELNVGKTLGRGQVDVLEPAFMQALFEHLGRDEGSGARKVLQALPKDDARSSALAAAKGPPSAVQWGAARYLELSSPQDTSALPALYAKSLEADDCGIRAAAANRLAELGDPSAMPALTALAKAPKEAQLFGQRNCGQDEAERALKKLSRKKR